METLPRELQDEIYTFVGVEKTLMKTFDYLFAKTRGYATCWANMCRVMELDLQFDDPYTHNWDVAWDFSEVRRHIAAYLDKYDCQALTKAVTLAHLKNVMGTATERDKIILLAGGLYELVMHWRNETCPFTEDDTNMFSHISDITHLKRVYDRHQQINIKDTILEQN